MLRLIQQVPYLIHSLQNNLSFYVPVNPDTYLAIYMPRKFESAVALLFRTSFLMLKINKLPASAGINKLINHILTAVSPIPRLFWLNIPNNTRLTFPRRPRSVNKAMVGIT